jgi:hypothetical protein
MLRLTRPLAPSRLLLAATLLAQASPLFPFTP